ncbi:MAG: hypothetical protein BroJett003_14140 [Planctomycetota bacterium]|nr:MAG: hypothetical protein BroJett003_14140 [Planctomycetota bacterium]
MSRINTNVPALQAVGRLRVNQGDLVMRLERLSTGLRINRGKDDPAGLIASETLRNEIGAIRQALENSQRAINVISTAEGALNEVSSLLQQLQGLVVEIANKGGLTEEEVNANQLEIDSILTSIDRISNTAEFGGTKLLDGSRAYTTASADTGALAHIALYAARVPEGSSRNVLVEVTQSAQVAELSFIGTTTSAVTIEISGVRGTDILTFASGTAIADIARGINDLKDLTGISAVVSGSNALILNSTGYGENEFVRVKPISGNFIEANSGSTLQDFGQDAGVLVNGQVASVDGLRVDVRSSGIDARFYLTEAFGTALSSTTFRITGGGAVFQLGPEVNQNAQVSLGFESISTGNLGNAVAGYLRTLASGNTNEVSKNNTYAAQVIISEAINQVAVYRGRLGSVQRNQIETNMNSQQVALENVTASESAIRDADYATEVAALTRAQILSQATQANLQLAIQLPSQVLSLLG